MKTARELLAIPAILTMLLIHGAFAQHVNRCATDEMTRKYMEEHAAQFKLVNADQTGEKEHEAFNAQFRKDQMAAPGTRSVQYAIPVVFHILHDNGPENISDAQILDAVRILNEDFQKRNADTTDVVADFANIIGNTGVEFRMARLDPTGNPTDGIVRYVTNDTYAADDFAKNGRQWPRDKYMNVWVAANLSSGAAGYTYTPATVAPGFAAGDDGIMAVHDYIGSIGTSNYSRSRTLTHEVGHWINLRHPWGASNSPGDPSNCSTDDAVSDTPNTKGNTSCVLSANSCDVGQPGDLIDNVQNFMEYSYCDRMFTEGQVTRMQTALNSSTASRSNLWSSSNLAATGVDELFEAGFSSPGRVVCEETRVYFTDESKFGQNTWNWTLTGGFPSTSTVQYPAVDYPDPGLYDVNLTVGNGTSTMQSSKQGYLLVASAIGTHTPYSESFETEALPNDDWLIVNPDEDSNVWKRTTDAAYSGSYSMKIDNISNLPGNVDELYSSSFDITPLTSATITFKMAYAQKTGAENDALKVYVSVDCGDSWIIRKNISGAGMATVAPQISPFVPADTSEWAEVVVSGISGFFISENLLIKFEFTGDDGNSIYIDDINIEGVFDPIPVLESPADLATGQPSNVLLNWKAIQDVDYYEYQLDVNSSFSSGSLITGTKNYISPDPNNSDTEFQTSGLTLNQTYYWRVRSNTGGVNSNWSNTWSFTISSTGVGMTEAQAENTVFTVFPNPLTSRSVAAFTLTESTDISLKIFDILGREVVTIFEGGLQAGTHRYQLPAHLSPGVYLARLQQEGRLQTVKIIIE